MSKLAHWDKYYIQKICDLTESDQNLTAQFMLIACLTAVEATVGNPKFRKDNNSRTAQFFEENLETSKQNEFAQKIEFHDPGYGGYETRPLRDVIEQLIYRRHGLLHRAELVNLPTNPSFGAVVAPGHDKQGRIAFNLYMSLLGNDLAEYTRTAINQYFSVHWSRRLPLQDFRIRRVGRV
jgi:hypothetical protein